jgi:hypothetical protein
MSNRSRAQAKRRAYTSAMSVADDIAQGRLDPAELDKVAAEECRALFGTVTGPENPLWSLHVEVCRQVLALRGIPANELSEWLGRARWSEQNLPSV